MRDSSSQPDAKASWRRQALSLLREPKNAALFVVVIIWLFVLLEWLWAHSDMDALRWITFCAGAIGAIAACAIAWPYGRMTRAIVCSIAVLFIWPLPVFICDYFGWSSLAQTCASVSMAIVFLIGLAWAVWGVERGSRHYLNLKRDGAIYSPPSQGGARGGLHPASSSTAHFQADATPPPLPPSSRSNPNEPDLALDLSSDAAVLAAPVQEIWNPIDLEAWYYGRKSPKLNQSLLTIFGYTLAFFLLIFLFNRLGGCQEIYEMPAGGGEEKPKVQVVKIQKVIRRKFVINPFSAVIFNPPPIEEVKLNLQELTKHEYQIGQGKGTGAGFSGGTNRGKVRFIRLEYRGGDWDQDFGVGADLNMLLRYGIETGHQVNDKTESRTIEELGRFALGKSPPMVYMTGQQSIQLSKREIDTLREFLIDKHGMIFADNGGSSQWHGQFFAMMDKVLEGTGVYPVKVPLDDVIHRIPFTLPFVPYVAPHGGKDAWGWYKDGRWIAYYHPGDIGDAWADGHAGVRREIYEACYQLGVNVIFYAHAEYNKWLDTREKKE